MELPIWVYSAAPYVLTFAALYFSARFMVGLYRKVVHR